MSMAEKMWPDTPPRRIPELPSRHTTSAPSAQVKPAYPTEAGVPVGPAGPTRKTDECRQAAVAFSELFVIGVNKGLR